VGTPAPSVPTSAATSNDHPNLSEQREEALR
jgi:hypothetical protein